MAAKLFKAQFFKAAALAAALAMAACGGTTETTAPELSAEAKARLAAAQEHPILLQKIADGVWVHTSTYTFPGGNIVPSNGLVVEDGEGLILIDTAWGELATQALLTKLKTETGKEVTKLVITHHHNDRLAGVDLLERKGVSVFTHPDTPGLSAAKSTAIPDTSVAALKEPGSRTKSGPIEIGYPGPGHAHENLVVYVPAAKVLFGGCFIRGKGQQGLGNIADANLKAWPKSLNWTKQAYGAATLVVPGHGQGADMSLINHTLGLLAKKINADAEAEKAAEEAAEKTSK